MACNPNRKGRCFQGGYVPTQENNLTRNFERGAKLLAQFYAKYGVTP